MILLTGGMGFIGLNVALHFIEIGEQVVLTQHRARRVPAALEAALERQAFIEPLDIEHTDDVSDVVKRHRVTDIVHLASPSARTQGSDGVRSLTTGLLNVLDAARTSDVQRVLVASSIWIYGGLSAGPFREDAPLGPEPEGQLETFRRIELQKKAVEALALDYAAEHSVDLVALRIGRVYGPLNYKFMAHNAPSRLAVEAARGEVPSFDSPLHAGDEGDWCYVKDLARGIQMLQAAARLEHTVFNVGSGCSVSNAQVGEAARAVAPAMRIDLAPGTSPDARPSPYMELSRIREAVGYEPEFDIARGMADYVAWLRSNAE